MATDIPKAGFMEFAVVVFCMVFLGVLGTCTIYLMVRTLWRRHRLHKL